MGLWYQDEIKRLNKLKNEFEVYLDTEDKNASFYKHPKLLRAWDNYHNYGLYPFSGGLFEQPAWVDRAFSYLDILNRYHRIDNDIADCQEHLSDITQRQGKNI
jgi:hypothetical protein